MPIIKKVIDKLIKKNISISVAESCTGGLIANTIKKYSGVSKMIKNIATLLQIKNSSVSIKATTNEKIGFIGNGEGIAAESIVHITDDKIS